MIHFAKITNPIGRKWEKLNSRCSTTTIATRTGVLTNPSRPPSPIFNFVYIVACLLACLSLITVRTNMDQMIWLVIYNQVCCMVGFLFCLLLSFNSNSSRVSLTGYKLIKLRFWDRPFGLFQLGLVMIWNG